MKFIIECLIICVIFFSYGASQNFSFPDNIMQGVKPVIDVLLTPRKHVERQKNLLKKEQAEAILKKLTEERNRRAQLTHSTMIDPDVLNSNLRWSQAAIKLSSRRVYPKSTTEAFQLNDAEKSEENNDENDQNVVSDSDDYDSQ